MTPKQILDLRLDLGLSQKAFADRLGVDRVTISNWERGSNKPSLLCIRKLEKLVLMTGGRNGNS